MLVLQWNNSSFQLDPNKEFIHTLDGNQLPYIYSPSQSRVRPRLFDNLYLNNLYLERPSLRPTFPSLAKSSLIMPWIHNNEFCRAVTLADRHLIVRKEIENTIQCISR